MSGGLTDREILVALELAKGHLEDAENVVWEASARADDEGTGADLEALTREIWRVEHALNDLRSELTEEGAEAEVQAGEV